MHIRIYLHSKGYGRSSLLLLLLSLERGRWGVGGWGVGREGGGGGGGGSITCPPALLVNIN